MRNPIGETVERFLEKWMSIDSAQPQRDELRASDNDTLGVMFRYTGTINYYPFSMELGARAAAAHEAAQWHMTTLWSDATAFQVNCTYMPVAHPSRLGSVAQRSRVSVGPLLHAA
jgi:hypothetical protein